MKLPLIAITILLSSSAAVAQESQEEQVEKQPLYHKTCEMFVSKSSDEAQKQTDEKIFRILQEKGYQLKHYQDEIKPLKKGLGLAGKNARARAEERHKIKNCEKIKKTLSLDFSSGWKTPFVGFNSVKVVQYKPDVSCAEKLGSLTEADKVVLKEEQHEFDKQKDGRRDLTEAQNIETLHFDTLLRAVVGLPKCEKSEALISLDPNTQVEMLAPPPEKAQELSIDDQERLRTKDLNLRELERIERSINGGNAR